ncbi:MAG: GtrA family protein [Clostridia bacterium]|nr:GtrA family protein [Clostridia bacterium]
MKKIMLQIIKFGLVGIVNTFVSYITYSVLFYFGVSPLICNIPAFIISVFVSFLLNSKFVFKKDESKEERKWWQVLLKTYISYSFTGLFLAEVLTALWLNVIHIENYIGFALPLFEKFGISLTPFELAGYLAPVLNLVFSIPINFVLNKFWAYRQKNKTDSETEKHTQ